MKKMLLLVGVVTLLQGYFIGVFSIAMLLILISRVLFASKLFGMKSKASATIIMEVMAIVSALIIPFVFKLQMHWLSFFIFVLLCLVSIITVVYDEMTYIYTEEEE